MYCKTIIFCVHLNLCYLVEEFFKPYFLPVKIDGTVTKIFMALFNNVK